LKNFINPGIVSFMRIERVWKCLILLALLVFQTACSQFLGSPSDNTAKIDQTEIDLQTSTPRPPATSFIPSTTYPTEEIIRGTVSIRHSWDETQMAVLAQIIKNFQTIHPDVQFDVLYVPVDNLRARYVQDTEDGIGPTLLLGPAEWGPELFKSGLITDLSTLIDDNLVATLNQPALETAKLDDKLFGVPYSIQGVVLYRNKDIVTLAPNNFDDFIVLAQTASQGDVIGAFLERSFFYSAGHLAGLGGQLMDANHAPAFNNEKGREWLELLKKFEEAGPTDYFTDADLERFKQGKVGWIIDGTWNMRSLAEAIGADKLAIDPWPSYQEGHLAGFVMADNLYLSAKAQGEDRTATLRFMEYLVSPEAQTLIAGANRIPAALTINPTDPEYGALILQAINAMAHGTAYPIAPEITTYSTNLDISLRAFFEHSTSPDQALQSAQEAIQAVLAQNPNGVTPVP
jgi:arabinogalactan oligomer / maltooligosaccharide transport system substrate-binding protein